MIKHYVKVALRLIKRSFLFSSINMLGFVFGMAAVEFRLYKDDAYLLLLAGVYQALQMGGGGLLSTCLDRNLVQVVVAGKVGKCRMINHEGTVGIRAGKHLADEAVCMLYLPDEYVVTFHVDAFIGFVYGAECIQNVSGNDLGVDGGIPDVGFHTTGVRMAFVYMPVFMMMCMGIVQNEFHILGHIEELQVGSIVRQFFRPCLLETDVADAEIGLALGKVDKLLGRGVVGFRT